MAQKSKAGGAKKKAKPKSKTKEESQFERFKETARTIGADARSDQFDEAFRKIVAPKHTK